MKAGKRILAGILVAMMVLSSVQFPGGVSYAEELPAVQESILEEESAVQEDASQQESEPVQEGTSGDDEELSDQETEDLEEKLPAEEENPEEKAGDEDGETEEGLPSDEVSVSDNDLQISGNDLMSVGEPEIWVDAEVEGAYQFGGAPSADDGIALYAESAYTDEEIMNYLYQQMKKRVTSIDVQKYNIPIDKVRDVFSGVLNENPDLYYVDNRFSYGYYGTAISSLKITYDTTLNDAVWQEGVKEALATVDKNMSDLQKAIVLHDYLTVNCEYDKENLDKGTVPSVSHSTYGVFANRMAVCDGYALSYKYLLKQVGIDCYMVTSDTINHAWNLIKLDGKYYQVDVTWDDPTWDLVGRSVHTNMFRSDANFDSLNNGQKHSGGRVTYGSQTVNYQAMDTRYDNAFWTNCTSPLVMNGSDCYYISPNGGESGKPALMKTSLSSFTEAGTPLQTIDRWTAWPSGSMAWQGAYSGLFRIGSRLYFNDKENIYSVAMDGAGKKTEFTANTIYGYIYGSAYYRGAVRYSLHDSPRLTEKEQVLKADIGAGGADPDAALNLANLFYEYTALDGKKINSAAEGRPKLLIFYRNACANCKGTIRNISRSIDSFSGVDIYALEIENGTMEEVAAIQKEYGCEEIIFSYDTGANNRNSMLAYIQEAGIEDASIAMPVLCYIDANNRLQYITRGLQSAEEVSSNLAKYCKYSQDYKITPPNITTYKVGQKISLTGGKVTYPSGNTTKTVTLAANMISGFDSSKPGICTVKVTAGGYMSSFDTLIVDEPKLKAAAGQSLGQIALPQNAYGTYTWKDAAQVVGKAGVYTFAAEFTPSDETKFQKLSDIQVEVTAQETLGTDTNVTFKTNQFTYNGAEQEPKVIVQSSDIVLKEGQDYELSYENNRNAGTATVIIDGMGCYLGSISRTFEIKPAQLVIVAKDQTILIGDPEPSEYQYEVSGLMAGDSLTVMPSFSCDIVSRAEAGRYEIVPSGADAGANYTISYKNGWLTVASEYVSCTVTFDVQEHGTAPAAQIGVKVGDTAEKPKDPTADGYRFDGWYQDAACTKAWNFDADIVQADMTLYAKWLEISKEGGGFAFQEIADMYYTGKACKPVVSVYDGDVLLKSGRDYQIKYYNNTSANKGGVLKQGNGEGADFNPELPYVEIIGKGDYTKTVKVNFNILRAAIGDGTENPAAGVTLKISEQLVTAKKVQKPFSSIKYVKGMKRDTDFSLHLTVENARDQSGKSLAKGLELDKAEIPAGYEGVFVLAVEGIGNYEGTIRKTIWVTDKAHLIKNAAITLGKNQKNITYSGGEVKLTAAETNSPDTFTVKYGKIFLKPGRDYTVSYRNNDKVGKAELIITGNGEYVGTKTVTFNIKGKTFSAGTVQVSGIENKVYTGRALTQNNAVLTYSTKNEAEKPLQYGTDYTITYAKNINKGSATMTFKGVEKAGYSGSFKKTFKITAADIADAEQVRRADAMNNMAFSYCKAGAKPVEEIVLTNNAGFVLRNGKDYTLKYKNNKAVADASAEKPPTVTVQGKGNYAGKFDVTFQITKRNLEQAVKEGSIQIKPTEIAYNPKKAETFEYKPAVKLMDGRTALRANTDYEIQYLCNIQEEYLTYLDAYEKAVENGAADPDNNLQEMMPRAVITAKAESSYVADGKIVVPLPIYRTKLVKKNLQIDVAEAVYTGSQLMPDVTVRDITGEKVLTKGKDYTVSYGANNKSGKNKGSVTITGIAPEYGGSVTVKFEVVKRPIVY